MLVTRNHWLASLSENTRRAYEYDFNLWETWLKENGVAVDQAERHHVEEWIKSMTYYSSSTIARRTAAVSSYYGYLSDKNPVAKVKRPSVTEHVDRTWLSDKELKLYAKSAELGSLRTRLVCHAALMGLRAKEICDLNLGSVFWREGSALLRVDGKGGKARSLPISAPLYAAIKEVVHGKDDDELEADKSRPLIFSRSKRRMSVDSVSYIIVKVGKLAGIERKVSPHVVRRSVATVALRNGNTIADVQQMLGHANVATTMTYIKMLEADDNPALPSVFDAIY